MKKIFTTIGIILVICLGVVLVKNNSSENLLRTSTLRGMEVVVHKSPTCGCCGEYIPYLKNLGAKVEVQETEKMNFIKSKHKVPALLESCHTSIIDGYVVEGHVPVEAILKLLGERPLISGISLPGMPAGSPGMGGTKFTPFKIHSITLDGEDGGVFMSS